MKTKYKVRALVMDEKGRVYAMRAKSHHVLQLPGGSRKPSEDQIRALKREIREETGFKVRILTEVTSIKMRRCGVQEITTCYVALIVKRAGKPQLTKVERKRGLRVKRYDTLHTLHKALSKRVRLYGRSAAQRDLHLTTAALERI